MLTTTNPATTTSPAAIIQSTVATKAIAPTVAAQGGSTFQTAMFSTV